MRRATAVEVLIVVVGLVLVTALLAVYWRGRTTGPGWVALPSVGCTGTTTKGLTVVSDTEWWVACRAEGIKHTTNGGGSYVSENAGLPTPVDITRIERTTHGVVAVGLGNQAAGGGIFKYVSGAWVRGNTHTPIGVTELANGDLLIVSQSVGGRPRAFRDHQGDLQFVVISGEIVAGVAGAGGVDQDPATHRLRISSEGGGVRASDDEGLTWFADGTVANGTGFGHTPTNGTLYFAQDQILRWQQQDQWEIVAHPSGVEGWKYVDTVNSFCWAIAADGVLYIGGDHVTYGIYAVTNHESLYTPFLEVMPGPPKGVRIYGVAVLPQSQRLLVIARDASVWLTAQPVVASGRPQRPGPVRVVPYG